MARARRILHATDFSPASRGAFAKAVELARADRADLTVVHALNVVLPVPADGYVSPKVYEDMQASARAYAKKQLDALVGRARKAGVTAAGLLVEGLPHEQIVRAARSRRADLLVIGTHGRTGLARFFLGSVAGRVLSLAPCPVLTVRK